MTQPDYASDKARIIEIVDTMYDAISWTVSSPPDLDRFSAAVRRDAVVVPAARPATTIDITSFAARMVGLHAEEAVKTFHERSWKTVVNIFGNIAVAIGSFEAVSDGSLRRGANAFLFVREADDWQIAGMAWDNETATTPLPPELI